MGRIVIAGYKPKPDKETELEQLMETHVPILRKEGLATERESIIMRAGDGTVVEVFEWVSDEAIEAAHGNTAVQKMWQAYTEVCDYVSLSTLKEADKLFAAFTPLN
jgi:quinol monooxygenase YgiN